MNIGNILYRSTYELKAVSIAIPDLDARILLSEVLSKGTTYLYSHPEALITNSDYQKFRRFIRRRKKGEPIAYIIGKKEFYGYTFKVNKNVLVPRPETELIIEETIKYIRSHCEESSTKQSDRLPRSARNDISIIDIGTGSGNIIISLMKEMQKLKIVNCKLSPKGGSPLGRKIQYHASDIDNKALRVAKTNAKSMNLYDDIIFYKSDLFNNPRIPNVHNIILANLPYVPINKLRLRTRDSINFEPKEAIFATDNGMKTIKRFLEQVTNRISKKGLILIEIDPRNAKELMEHAKKTLSKSKIELLKDLASRNRLIRILT